VAADTGGAGNTDRPLKTKQGIGHFWRYPLFLLAPAVSFELLFFHAFVRPILYPINPSILWLFLHFRF